MYEFIIIIIIIIIVNFSLFYKILYKFIFYQTIQISLILLHYSNASSREQCWLQQIIFTLFDNLEIILRQN